MASTSTEPNSTSSIKKLAIRGAIWTTAGYGISLVLRFASNIVLTRWLEPDLFGLMSLVYVFIVGLHLFSDLGLNTSVVQNKRGDEPAFLNTAWSLQILRGLLLWGICLVIAIPVSQFYGEPRLAILLPIVGFNAVLSGFNSTSLFTLNRHLSVKQLALFELSSQIVSLAVMLIWARISPSIWALVIGGTVSAVFQLIVSHRLNKGERNRPIWDATAVHELLHFGKWIFLSTALTFLANQSDRLFLGKLFSLELLGVYGIAFTLSDMPRSLLLAMSSKVIYPSYARMIDLPRPEFREKVLRNRKPILLPLAIGLAVFIGFGDLLIHLLYDERYTAASWMLPLLALGTWPIILTQTVDSILMAMGKPQYGTLGYFFGFLCYAIGIPLGFSLAGPLGAIVAVSMSYLPSWIVITWGLKRERASVFRQDMLMTAVFLTALALTLGTRFSFNLQNMVNHFTQ
ncbi:oligosaccharide flippase family protein [Leptolyngbya ohadii]|uniref:oligosaccharide flippase family protein n=1 Tax=Leptolyngbya ohadii TaxID=1962290 RepID=UPI000B5A090F|nr:oligosaccharide flippase family protein [Leptolyngbya ohadii]